MLINIVTVTVFCLKLRSLMIFKLLFSKFKYAVQKPYVSLRYKRFAQQYGYLVSSLELESLAEQLCLGISTPVSLALYKQ